MADLRVSGSRCFASAGVCRQTMHQQNAGCLLYTSDAADERSSVDLGGRRIIKKKKQIVISKDTIK